jgi:hypothetical protein
MSSPHDTPFTFVSGSDAGQPWRGAEYDWQPNAAPADSHDIGYDVIGDEIAPPEGEVPPNIVATPGPFSRSKGV